MIVSDADYSLLHERARKIERGDSVHNQEDALYWADMTKQTLQFIIEKLAKGNYEKKPSSGGVKVF